MEMRLFMQKALEEQMQMLPMIREEEIQAMAAKILESRSLFVAGMGRSGNVMKMFCMRCMHMGMRAYVVGETVTPAIQAGDLLLIGSGSGETASLVSMANKAKKIGAGVGVITIHRDSTIGKLADRVIELPGTTKKSEMGDSVSSIQPSGNLFEQIMLLMLDCMIPLMAEKRQFDVDDLFTLHANLE